MHAQAQVIHVVPRGAGGGAALPADLAPRIDKVDQRLARAQLHQAERLQATLQGAAEHIAVERLHHLEVSHPQHHVVQLQQGEWWEGVHGMKSGGGTEG